MSAQMDLFARGGLNDEGGEIDKQSGNRVPVGGTKKGVRDDISANVSEGEFVFPEDVTRYIGLEKLMSMRQKAKMGLQKMEDMGQMGNGDEATLPDDMPFDMADLIVVGGRGEPMEFANGGFVPAKNYHDGGGVEHSHPKLPDYEAYMNSVQVVAREYRNAEGESISITFINGTPTIPIPTGFALYVAGEEEEKSPVAEIVEKVNDKNGEDEFDKVTVKPIDYNSMTPEQFHDRMKYESSTAYKFEKGFGLAVASLAPLGGILMTASMRQHDRRMETTMRELIKNAPTQALKKEYTESLNTFLKQNGLKSKEEANLFGRAMDKLIVDTGFTLQQGKTAGAAVANNVKEGTTAGTTPAVQPLDQSSTYRDMRAQTSAVSPATQTDAVLGSNVDLSDMIAKGSQRPNAFENKENEYAVAKGPGFNPTEPENTSILNQSETGGNRAGVVMPNSTLEQPTKPLLSGYGDYEKELFSSFAQTPATVDAGLLGSGSNPNEAYSGFDAYTSTTPDYDGPPSSDATYIAPHTFGDFSPIETQTQKSLGFADRTTGALPAASISKALPDNTPDNKLVSDRTVPKFSDEKKDAAKTPVTRVSRKKKIAQDNASIVSIQDSALKLQAPRNQRKIRAAISNAKKSGFTGSTIGGIAIGKISGQNGSPEGVLQNSETGKVVKLQELEDYRGTEGTQRGKMTVFSDANDVRFVKDILGRRTTLDGEKYTGPGITKGKSEPKKPPKATANQVTKNGVRYNKRDSKGNPPKVPADPEGNTGGFTSLIDMFDGGGPGESAKQEIARGGGDGSYSMYRGGLLSKKNKIKKNKPKNKRGLATR